MDDVYNNFTPRNAELFRVKELATQKEYYVGCCYNDPEVPLDERSFVGFIPTRVGKYEVSAIYPDEEICYDDDGYYDFYQKLGPEASPMTLEIKSIGGGKQYLVPIPVEKLTISPKIIKLKPNTKRTLTAEVSPRNASYGVVYWAVDEEGSVAYISTKSDGLREYWSQYWYKGSFEVCGVEKGTAKIIVSTEDGKYVDEALVIVSDDDYIPITSLKINKTNLSLVLGKNETEVLRATVQPANATNKKLIWTSDKPNIATVDENGKVTAVSVGTATISVTDEYGVFKESCEVTVKEVEQHRINKTLVVGGSIIDERLAKTREDGNDYSITYSDRGIVSISNQGVIRGQRAGHVTAKVIKADVVYTLEIDVINPITGANSYSKNTGDKFSLGFNAGGLPVTYSSGKPDIASIDENGNITAKAKGSATITATVQGKKYTANLRGFWHKGGYYA